MPDMTAKDIILRPIDAKTANALVRRVHYSGKVVNNSQLHIGVYIGGKLEGAMQFGPSLDKRKIVGLVEGTGWNEVIELNRMAFTDALPRNSESRALAIAMRLIRKHAPHVKWVVTFADGTQCGDGTIYRAAGFVLTAVNKNTQIWSGPDEGQSRESRLSLTDNTSTQQKVKASTLCRVSATKGSAIIMGSSIRSHDDKSLTNGASSMRRYREAGFKPLPGHQLRYIYFIDPSCRERLTVPLLPFSEIERKGAGMYRGQPRAGSIGSDATTFHGDEGGATPTPALHDTATRESVAMAAD